MCIVGCLVATCVADFDMCWQHCHLTASLCNPVGAYVQRRLFCADLRPMFDGPIMNLVRTLGPRLGSRESKEHILQGAA